MTKEYCLANNCLPNTQKNKEKHQPYLKLPHLLLKALPLVSVSRTNESLDLKTPFLQDTYHRRPPKNSNPRHRVLHLPPRRTPSNEPPSSFISANTNDTPSHPPLSPSAVRPPRRPRRSRSTTERTRNRHGTGIPARHLSRSVIAMCGYVRPSLWTIRAWAR